MRSLTFFCLQTVTVTGHPLPPYIPYQICAISLYTTSTQMCFTGIMDRFSNASKIDLMIWALTLGSFAPGVLQVRKQNQTAKSKTGPIKESTTYSSIRLVFTMFGQIGAMVGPAFVYWTAIPWNGFRQPGWMMKYALPSPPDVFGIDGVVVGRAVGLLGFFASRFITRTAFKTLGDQYHPIGVSTLILSL